ncbi:MAG: hypothetical protein AAFX94_01585, partial [Myxococcota bacterium]
FSQARSSAEQRAMATPAIGLGIAMESLAGVGTEASASYRGFLVDALQARGRWILERAWEKRPLEASDFQALVKETPRSFQAAPAGLAGPLRALVGWTLFAWILAFFSVRKL